MKAKESLLLTKVLRVIYPNRCILCDRVISREVKYKSVWLNLCEDCKDKLVEIKDPVCPCCGRPVSEKETLCSDCITKKHEFISGRFTLSYECIARSIYRFKYNNKPFYAKDYARIIYQANKDWIEYINPDGFIPVPLHKKRMNKRGYNQALELSRALSELTGIPTYDNYVLRIKNTIPQKVFDRKGRQINMKKAFIVPKNDVKLTIVILVDDIFTTGSTIDAISKELKHQGTSGIYFITITAAGT